MQIYIISHLSVFTNIMKNFLSNFYLLCILLYLFAPTQSLASDFSSEATIEKLLAMSLEELIEVEISIATRTPKPIHKAPAIATVITAREIKNMGANNLMDVLKMVPGFNISRNNEGFFLFDIRGISTVASEKILFMIDGHSLNNNYIGGGLKYLADYLSVGNIKQVEIIRGPGSALYGNSAFVAVLNIVTKDSKDHQGVELNVTGGNFDTWKVNFLGANSFDNGLEVFASFDYWETNGPDLLIEKDMLSGSPFSNAPGNPDTSYESMEMLLKLSYKDVSYEGHFINNDRGVYIGFGNSLTDNNSMEFQNYWHEIHYIFLEQETYSSSIKIYWNEFEQDALITVMPAGFLGSYPNGMIGGPKIKDRTLGSEVRFDYDISEKNHLLTGLLYEEIKQYDVKHLSNFHPLTFQFLGSVQNITSWGNFNRDVVRDVFAAYIQDEWQLTDTLNLTVGLRYDNYSDFGDTTNPRASLVWNFLENAEFKLLYGQAFRAPNFAELYNKNNPTVVGNPKLHAEEISTYEAAIGYRFLKHLRFDANYFYNDINDIIVRDNSTSPARYGNLGGTEIDGFELILTGDYNVDNYWRLSYSYKDPEDADTGDRIPFVPNDQASLSLNYAFTDYLVSHVDVLWIGSRPRPAGDSRDDINSYTTIDVSLTLRNLIENMEIQWVIHNLLDEDYRDPDLSGAAHFIPNDYPRASISGMVTISYKF